ncbi:hypothetical protein ACFQ1S_10750 [Kibdelosporangium lantanae]|uniref:Uncharacterized protein n=1 Tax=Kibdelosporangium lantanae TaxID=1497396 RepID=A0ABW3M5U4_9PSEU
MGGDQLVEDLNLAPGERVGVTVSGGKDGLAAWLWLVDALGAARVVAFNHDKFGLVHPLAARNLDVAHEILGSKLVRVADGTMLPRFRANIEAFFKHPDPAMVRVSLCAGCRFGISGRLFAAGASEGITKFVNAASYLEIAPFKAALMKGKGGGCERIGLLTGLKENPAYDHGDNLRIIDIDDRHDQKRQLAGGKCSSLYPGVSFLDFDRYFPNVPNDRETLVADRLDWRRPRRSWHFDCLVEEFKDVFYYGLIGYTETDYYLSAQTRHGLVGRVAAISSLLEARKVVIGGLDETLELMDRVGIGHLKDRMRKFYDNSPFLTSTVSADEPAR